MQAEEKVPEKVIPEAAPFEPIVMGDGFAIKGGIYKVSAVRTRGRINLKFVETAENARKRMLRQQAGRGTAIRKVT